jgi:hypothetical protein
MVGVFVELAGVEPAFHRFPKFVFSQAYQVLCSRKQGPELPPDKSTSPFSVWTNIFKASVAVTAYAAAC